jgi:sugar transferase (PEP-CTERM/EpsH1 system associated)
MIDEKKDFRSLEVLSSIVKEICFDVVHPLTRKLLSSMALLQSKPISVAFFYSRKIQKWIDDLLRDNKIDAILCSSSPTAEYVFRSSHSNHYTNGSGRPLRTMDLIDVDSHKWEQYAERSMGPMREVYKLEARNLETYEKRIAGEFNHLFLSTAAEQALFLKRVPATNTRVIVNGVDFEYFSNSFQPAIERKGPVLAFVGAMDYYPNADGARWFVREVYPAVQKAYPDITFYIVGSRPSAGLKRLAQTCPGVEVTGYVKDIRPYLAGANVCVAPLHIARGVQNKVLEAMAMGKALVCTPQALEGIDAEPGKHALAATDPYAFAGEVIRLLGDEKEVSELGARARSFIEEKFSWQNNLALLDDIFD